MNQSEIIRMAREVGGTAVEHCIVLTYGEARRFAALVAAAEPVQEPVAWMHPDGRVMPAATMNAARSDGGASLSSVRDYTIPLFPQRPPLTNEEIVEAVREADLDWQAGWTLDEHEPNRFTTLARAVERKVRGETE